jgi:hypothetical protein
MKPWENRSLKNLSTKWNGQLYVEEWVNIVDFEEMYMISSFGRVKSLERIKSIIRKGHPVDLYIKERIVGQFLDGGGYPGVKISKEGKPHWYHTHRLVGMHFIENPQNLPEINHTKGKKEDNRKWKLEWSTKSDNIKHAFRMGLNRSLFQNFGKENPKSKPVSQYSKDGTFIKTFAGQSEAERETGTAQASIWRVCNGVSKTAGGYVWKYAKGFGLGRKGANIHEKKIKK